MTDLFSSVVAGRWQACSDSGAPPFDPVPGREIVRVQASGLDLSAAFGFARQQGGAALQALICAQRAELLSVVVRVLRPLTSQAGACGKTNGGIPRNGSVRREAARVEGHGSPGGGQPDERVRHLAATLRAQSVQRFRLRKKWGGA